MSGVAQQAEGMLKPLGGHAVFLLLIQLALLLTAARLGAETAKRMGLPAVVGELAAGIVVGPTLFGHFFPGAFAVVFPHDSSQFQLLEVVGTLGMVLLLLLTGLETDLRLLRNLGRAALIASAMGMVIPFATGFGLGFLMPDDYLADPSKRVLFSFFLATAMAISAMPVIAKILMDLELTKRNIGLVILSAGVVDDTAGWLILSVIAGVASHGEVRLGGLATTLVFMAGFLAIIGLVLYPVSRWLMSLSRRFRSADADLALLLIITFACAAATEWIGIHAVFGAFICGTMFRQIHHLEQATIHKLESFVFAVLAPIFFGIVGLKVDLWTLGGGGWLVIVLAVACFGKLVGCTLGSLWGGLRFWEGLSIAVAMNARGAMELVVATIGLSLGILNQEMFSIIVVVAVATSFAAPLGLRLTMRKVRMTAEESKRLMAEASKGAFDPKRVRVLLPSAGGPNALAASMLAHGVARRSANPVQVLSVKAPTSWRDRFERLLGRRVDYATDDIGQIQQQITNIQQAVAGGGLPPSVRQVEHKSVAAAILEEARKGVDLLFVGASRRGNSLGGPILEELVRDTPCHLAVVKAGPRAQPYKSLLVPFDGGVFSRVAVELAVRYAEATGAELTIALLIERMPQAARLASEEPSPVVEELRPSPEAELEQVSRIFRAVELRPSILRLTYDPQSDAVNDEASSGLYDLVIMGAENRAMRNRLFFGYSSERLLNNDNVAVAILVPNIARLHPA
jgi:Kef-type K+ transport system membrane component KefB/nucleotide-binding universal stress UspA family protein